MVHAIKMKLNNSCDGIYKNSLDVRFGKQCDNNCSFCIEKNGISGKPINVQKMVQQTIKSEKKEILILGGEPFLLMSQLLEYVSSIRNHVNKIYITTSLPKTIDEQWSTFEKIMGMIDGLNVSLQHYDWIINNEILNASSFHNRLDLLKKICRTDKYANKIRVSINLVKGAIDNKEKINQFLLEMINSNVKHVKINELQHCEDLYISFCDVYDCLMESPYSYGCQTDIYLADERFRNLKITLKRSCFCVNKNLDATISDLFKVILKKIKKQNKVCHQSVLYEDGMLCIGWKTKE